MQHRCRNGGPDMADDGSSIEPKPVRCYQNFFECSVSFNIRSKSWRLPSQQSLKGDCLQAPANDPYLPARLPQPSLRWTRSNRHACACVASACLPLSSPASPERRLRRFGTRLPVIPPSPPAIARTMLHESPLAPPPISLTSGATHTRPQAMAAGRQQCALELLRGDASQARPGVN